VKVIFQAISLLVLGALGYCIFIGWRAKRDAARKHREPWDQIEQRALNLLTGGAVFVAILLFMTVDWQ
jgi:hypothetical protein